MSTKGVWIDGLGFVREDELGDLDSIWSAMIHGAKKIARGARSVSKFIPFLHHEKKPTNVNKTTGLPVTSTSTPSQPAYTPPSQPTYTSPMRTSAGEKAGGMNKMLMIGGIAAVGLIAVIFMMKKK